MSMLAERRRKTKWVINPTKKPIWTTDSEGIKLGKQLMEKMGWSAGKGLGANEQGIQEPLKVSYKNDTKGMGFKGNDEDWMEHQDEFNSLLSQLSSTDASKRAEVDKNEIKSLEEKSKHSRARVHYQKFTRGKDLSRYSETDLACILGINHKKQKNSLAEKNPIEGKKDGNYETSFGVTTVNSGSILDYFKKKWTIDKSKENNSSSKTPYEVTEESTSNNTEEIGLTPEHKKSKKRRINELDCENLQVPDEKTIMTLEEVKNSEIGEEVEKVKKSKKRKINEPDGENREVPENETIEASEEVENSCSLEVEKKSKKHKKSKKKKKEGVYTESESVSKVHKKEKYYPGDSDRIEECNQAVEVTAGVENVSNDCNSSPDDRKSESLPLSRENSKDGDENFTRKRKKDKKKDIVKELDTPEENVESVHGDSDHKIKKKKKKDKEKKEKEEVSQSEIKEVIGETYSGIGKHDSSLTENGEAKSVSNGDEKNEKLRLMECAAVGNPVDLESEKSSRKEKKKKERHKSDRSKLENEKGVKIECEIVGEESKSKSKKRKEKHTDQLILENEGGQKTKAESIPEEVGPAVKEKKKKGKYKTHQSKLENEMEQETETKSTSERTEESRTKEKKKKGRHRSDQSTLVNQEEGVTKSVNSPEKIEPKIEGKTSKKDKLSETKKSKHKTDNEEIDNSNINSESVVETNDDTIQKDGERLGKTEIDDQPKEDTKKLAKVNKREQEEGKDEDGSRIHSHKVELFKRKKNGTSLLGDWPKTSPNSRVMGLIFGAEFEKFKGSNVEKLVGYGMQKKTQGRDDG